MKVFVLFDHDTQQVRDVFKTKNQVISYLQNLYYQSLKELVSIEEIKNELSCGYPHELLEKELYE